MGAAAEEHRPGPVVNGVELVPGTRVRLRPSRRADIVDMTLIDRVAEVDRIEVGTDGRVYVVVALEGDPALGLGPMSQIGHRFFFAPDELEPLAAGRASRVLVAGIGDAFRPGGAFAQLVVESLRSRRLPAGVHAADFGIRAGDLAHALPDYDTAIFVCAVSEGKPPGTVSLLDLTTDPAPHVAGVDFAAAARAAGRRLKRYFAVTCDRWDQQGISVDSESTAEIVDEGVRFVENLVHELTASTPSKVRTVKGDAR